MTRNPVKLLPGIFLKAGMKKSSSEVQFSYKMMPWALRKDTPNYNKIDLNLQGTLLGVLRSPKRLQGTTRVSKMPPKETSRHPESQTRHPDNQSIQTSRQPDIQTCRQPDIQTARIPDIQTCGHPYTQTSPTTRHPDIQTPLTSHQSPLRGRRQGAKPLR